MPPDQWQVLHGIVADQAGDIIGLGGNHRCGRRHLHNLRGGADLQAGLNIDDLVGVEGYVRALESFEPGSADADAVDAQIEAGNVEHARGSSHHMADRARALIDYIDLRLWDQSAGRIFDRADDGPESALGEAGFTQESEDSDPEATQFSKHVVIKHPGT